MSSAKLIHDFLEAKSEKYKLLEKEQNMEEVLSESFGSIFDKIVSQPRKIQNTKHITILNPIHKETPTKKIQKQKAISQTNYIVLKKWVESEISENPTMYQSLSFLYENFKKYTTQENLPTTPKRLFSTSLETVLEKRDITIEKKRTSQEVRIYGIELKNYNLDSNRLENSQDSNSTIFDG